MTNNIYKIYVTSKGEWEELELDNLNLSTTFSVEELKDISKRKDTISKDIVLKGTKKNNKVFGALYSIDREVRLKDLNTGNLMYNYKPNKYLDCFVLENNVEIIRGKLLVTSVNIDKGVIYYHCSIVGTVYSFFSEMNERKLEELDYFKLDKFSNIRLNKGYIEDSWKLPVVDPEVGFNLFNSQDTEIGKIVSSNGSIVDDGGIEHRATDYIEVKPNTTYTFTRSNSGNNNTTFAIATYTESRAFVNYNSTTNAQYTLTTGSNVGYVRFSYPRMTTNIKFEEGSFTGFSDNPEDRPEFFFPMIDYGGSLGGREGLEGYLRWDYFRPAIYVSSYFKAIFRGFRINSKGEVTQYKTDNDISRENLLDTFSFKGGVTEEEWFNRIFVPHNDVRFSTLAEGVREGNDIIYYRQLFNSRGQSYSSVDTDDNMLRVFQPLQEVNSSSNVSNNLITIRSKVINGKLNNYIDFAEDLRGRITVSANITSTGGIYTPSDSFYLANLKVNPEASGTVNSYDTADVIAEVTGSDVTDLNGNNTVEIDFDTGEDNIDLSGGFVIGAKNLLDNTIAGQAEYRINSLTVTVLADTDNPSTVGVQYNEEFNVFDAIPKEISVRDFLKSVMLMANLYLMVDKEDSNKITLYTYDEFYNNFLNFDRSTAIDWSNKVDWESYTIASNTSLPRGYTFSYKDDKDVMNQTYTRLWKKVYGSWEIEDSSGLTEPKKVELMFSPTITKRITGGFELPIIYEADGIAVGERKPMKSNLRLLMFSGSTTAPTVIPSNESGDYGYKLLDNRHRLVSIGGSDVFFNRYPISSMILYSNSGGGKGDPISSILFGVPKQAWVTKGYPLDSQTLYNRYYFNQIKETTDINLVTVEADVFLNEYDINTLDFRNPIYLQSPYGSAYFKLLKVEYTDSNYPSTVLLQKVVLPDTNR